MCFQRSGVGSCQVDSLHRALNLLGAIVGALDVVGRLVGDSLGEGLGANDGALVIAHFPFVSSF
jgi:hypothetical protein